MSKGPLRAPSEGGSRPDAGQGDHRTRPQQFCGQKPEGAAIVAQGPGQPGHPDRYECGIENERDRRQTDRET
jgi:hypothetical protein